jgi:hypothetical protein
MQRRDVHSTAPTLQSWATEIRFSSVPVVSSTTFHFSGHHSAVSVKYPTLHPSTVLCSRTVGLTYVPTLSPFEQSGWLYGESRHFRKWLPGPCREGTQGKRSVAGRQIRFFLPVRIELGHMWNAQKAKWRWRYGIYDRDANFPGAGPPGIEVCVQWHLTWKLLHLTCTVPRILRWLLQFFGNIYDSLLNGIVLYNSRG